MSPSHSSSSDQSDDPLFPLFAGLYVALLVTAPVMYAVSELGVTESGPLYGAMLVTVTVVTGAGWWVVAAREWVATRLGATAGRWVPGIVGVATALAGLASLGQAGVASAVAFFFGAGAMVLGGVLGVMARTRHTAAVLDGADRHCEFRAGWPEAARNRMVVVVVPLMIGGIAGFAWIYLGTHSWLVTVAQALLPVGVTLLMCTEQREYTVTDVGLEHRMPVARQVFRWAAFTGYSRTDDALVLHRPWRLDIRLALDDLGDPDAVEAAVAEYLRAT